MNHLEEIKQRSTPEIICQYFKSHLHTDIIEEQNQFRITGQGGLFVNKSCQIAKPGDGKHAGGTGLLPAIVYCRTGGQWSSDKTTLKEAIHEACDLLQIPWTNGLPKKPQTFDFNHPTAVYSYTDEHNTILYQNCRFEWQEHGERQKTFRQRHYDESQRKWVWNVNGQRIVPYNLPAVLKETGMVFDVEGEKDVETLRGFSLTALSFGKNSQFWGEFSFLSEGRSLVVCEDNDSPGQKSAQKRAEFWTQAGSPVKLLTFRNLPEKSDITDWVHGGGTKEQLLDLIAEIPLWEPLELEQVPMGEVSPQQEPTTSLPPWCFWNYTVFKDKINIQIDPLKYLEFVTACGFRIFQKRGMPVVVEETSDSMNKTIIRGKINTTVKTDVINSLLETGFDDVAGFFIMNPKYFMIDTLESLPLIPDEKAQYSIFSEMDTHINFKTQLVKETPLLTFDDSPLLSACNVFSIVGKQGLGKSGVCELFASMAINPDCEPESPFNYHSQGGLILWIDSERPVNDMFYTRDRIAHRVDIDNHPDLLTPDKIEFSQLRIERCRTIDEKMVWLLELVDSIEGPIELLIIDSVLDFVENMNDEIEARRFFADVEQIADKRQCGIILTIHSAPNDERGKGMGHAGTKIMQKSASFLQIRNNTDDPSIKELSTDFTHAKMRHGKDWGIYAAIQWDEGDHMLHFIDYTPPEAQPKAEKAKEDARTVFEFIFQKEAKIKFTTLKERYAEKTGKTERTAQNHIKKALGIWGILMRDDDIYTLRHL